VITRALADANVLYSRTLRDWLIMIQLESKAGIYMLCWTEDIMAEVIYNLRREKPELDGGKITRLRDLITRELEGGRIDDFVIDGSFQGTDPNDQHVHAAAVTGRVSYLITRDGGFRSPDIDQDRLPYEVHSADSFLVMVDDYAPEFVRAVAQQQEDYWDQRPGSKPLPQALQDAGCPYFAQRVLEHLCNLPASNTNV
jgi:hypothetical protein